MMGKIARAFRRRLDVARDAGMSTAEYAVGTIAATAFAGLLYKIVTSAEVQKALLGIINKALQLAQ
ncbi:DUF4244 domain-containing protein [Actinomadura rupiterrae]|uniref:DUF4244 domain-containing protein n=1 Tax=Actinomadura rupiterrae TaxID=559627 RepID=UPI0035566AFA|nr:hypothetical protein [Actinomadura rupiterrae]